MSAENERQIVREVIRAWSDQPQCDKLGSHEEEELTDRIVADLAKLHAHWLEQLKEDLLGEKAQAVVADFLCSWRFCPASQAAEPARSCLEDAAMQLLDALKASIPIEEGGDG